MISSKGKIKELENEACRLKKEVEELVNERSKMIDFIKNINKENGDSSDDNFRIILDKDIKSIDNTKVLLDLGLDGHYDCNGSMASASFFKPVYTSVLELLKDEGIVIKIEKKQKYIYDSKKEVLSLNTIREVLKEKLKEGYTFDKHIDFINRCEKDPSFDVNDLKEYYMNIENIETSKETIGSSEINKMNDLLIKYK